MQTRIVGQPSQKSELLDEVKQLFRNANTARLSSGITASLQNACVRQMLDECDSTSDVKYFNFKNDDCGDGCNSDDNNPCEEPLIEACSIEETIDRVKDRTPLDSIGRLLTKTKIYEYIALVENAYAIVGNKPFKLVSDKKFEITDEQQEELGRFLVEQIQSFIDENQVRVNELSDAFDFSTLSEVTESLSNELITRVESDALDTMGKIEHKIEQIFNNTDYMRAYIEVIRDTAEYPLGVLWIEDDTVKRTRDVVKGKLKYQTKLQSTVKRIDPCYFWATNDWRIHEAGKAVFKLEQFSAGDLRRWQEVDVVGSKKVNKQIREFLEDHPDGYRNLEAMLFHDHGVLSRGVYDVMVCRGQLSKRAVKEFGVKIPDQFSNDDYIPTEVYYAGEYVLRIKILEYVEDDLGVFTTTFRRSGRSIWGYSLHDFIYPFADMYQASMKAIDKSVGKSIKHILQIDTGVLEDPDKYMSRDEDGVVEMDLSEDTIIEFDSSKAFTSPNFKGVPLHVTSFPTTTGNVLPIIDLIYRELEIVSGIPSILNGGDISSALRTTENMNMAFNASNNQIKTLLREPQRRILKPSIDYIYITLAGNGDISEWLTDVEPRILLADTLILEENENQNLILALQTVSQSSDLVPSEKLGKLLNTIGRKVYDFDEDLVPNVGVMSTSNNPKPQEL